MRKKTTVPLKESCVDAAREVIAESGLEALSLREVARKLGVSHQAPYRHYPSRDHLLAAVMSKCFIDFRAHLEARQASDNPDQDLGELGRAYLSYARSHSLEYRLMFGTPWPAPAEHPDLVRNAVYAFDVLRGVLRRLGEHMPAAQIDQRALFIWSCMHGLSGIRAGDVMQHLAIDSAVAETASEQVLAMIGLALRPPE